MKYLLNERELDGVHFVERKYRQKFNAKAVSDPDLFVNLQDTPSRRLSWSAVSGHIPTFRTGGGKMYNLHKEVWMTPRDKLAALGFPVTPETAKSMGTPILPVCDGFRAAAIAGNSFHFASATVVQLIALACFKLKTD